MKRPAFQLVVHSLGVVVLLLLAPGALSAEQLNGTLTGTVRFVGKVPPAKKVVTDGVILLHNDLVVEPKTRGLRDVVVVLEDAPARPKVKKAKPLRIDQRDMIYLPRVVAVQQGQVVRFDNSDQCNHSVLAASPLKENAFNLYAGPNEHIDHAFVPQKHPVLIGCSLHAWMRAWVYVFSHPWFAITDQQGQFKIEGIPPGKYTLWLRHADTGKQERRMVEIKAGQTVEVKMEWETVD